MFNHARTLLLNIEGGPKSPGPEYLGEELIPAEFRKLNLPTYLDNIRRFMFGATPDRAMLNYRAAQLMTLVHSTKLSEFTTDLDSRITYDVADEHTLYEPDTFVPVVNRYEGAEQDTLTILGKPIHPDPVGRVRFDYNVDVLTPSTIEVKRLTPKAFSDIQTITMTNGLSNILNLTSAGYTFRVNTNSPGTGWNIGGYFRPMWGLGQIEAILDRLSEPTTLSLFGLTNEEPWSTFRNLWFDHPELPYRLGSFVLAMIYRAEEVRVGS